MVGASAALYWLVRKILFTAANGRADMFIAVLGLTALAGVLSRLRYEDLPKFISIFVRVIGIATFIQEFFDAFNFSPDMPNVFSIESDPMFGIGAIISLLVGAAAIFRPSFLLPTIGYYIMFRSSIVTRTGIDVVPTDYLGMAECGLFGTVGALLIASPLANRISALVRARGEELTSTRLLSMQTTAFSIVWGIMVGAHLRNYLFSGLAKVSAGQTHPLTWLLHNATQTSILMGLERGDNPLSHAPWALQGIWNTFLVMGPVLNAVVLGAQLAAPLGALNKRVLLALTIFYDMFHIGVYLTLGALFFFWVLVNVLVFATARHLPGRKLTLPISVAMLLTMAFGGRAFYTNHLGWLDGAKLASSRFYAETKDGQLVDIPGPYFGLYAYNIAQGRLYVPVGSFPLRTGGNTTNLKDWEDANSCGPVVTTTKSDVALPAVAHMITETDRFARSHPWFKSLNSFYFYPSHMMPNPFDFAAFNRLKINDIVGYVYRVDSVCLTLENGRLQRNVKNHWETHIPVSSAPAA
jgi:hypothetical protein